MGGLSSLTVLFGDKSLTSPVLHIEQTSHWKYKFLELCKITELEKMGRTVIKDSHFLPSWWYSTQLSTEILTWLCCYSLIFWKITYNQFLTANDCYTGWVFSETFPILFFFFCFKCMSKSPSTFHMELSNSCFSLFSHYLLLNHNHFQREKIMHPAAGANQV